MIEQIFEPILITRTIVQAIAIHTFCVLVFRWGSPPMTAHITIAFIWTFIALIIGISFATHKGEMYYGNTGYCM